MASYEASGLNTQKTIREYLSDQISENVGIKITLNSALTSVYNVDLIWNGQNYLISYSLNEGVTEGETTTLTTYIKSLDSVLPITFDKVTTTTTS